MDEEDPREHPCRDLECNVLCNLDHWSRGELLLTVVITSVISFICSLFLLGALVASIAVELRTGKLFLFRKP